jgi:hypothetical protein
MAVYSIDRRVAYAHEKITDLSASVGGTSTTYNVSQSTQAPYDKTRRPEMAYITVETAAIRATFDGTVPTVTAGTALGHLFSAGDTIVIEGYENISKVRAINAVAASGAALRISYFRE